MKLCFRRMNGVWSVLGRYGFLSGSITLFKCLYVPQVGLRTLNQYLTIISKYLLRDLYVVNVELDL